MKRTVVFLITIVMLLAGCASQSQRLLTEGPLVDRKSEVYVIESHRQHEQGTVRLQVLVDEQGVPAQSYVLKSSGKPALDELAQSEVKKWRFVPARLKGKPVVQSVLVPIRFVYKPERKNAS
jgi:TonB family protein